MSGAAVQLKSEAPSTALCKPRLGFMGTGWIGRLRMEALAKDENATFSSVYDPSTGAAEAAAALGENISVASSYESLLDSDIDGVVIATPSALHAAHCQQALASGKAVFCQKPLARDREESRAVVDAARAANKLLGVDFSYRHLAGMDRLREMIAAGELGEIFAADLVFHNAYGPDKDWFYDIKSAGGGCVMDLGIHLVDSAFWLLGHNDFRTVESQLYCKGQRLQAPLTQVEDYAAASFMLGESHVRLCCSWNLHAGQDAVIEMQLHGTRGGAALRNVAGSFFDFEIHRFHGTGSEQISGYPDAWGARALSQWVNALARSDHFDPEVEQAVRVAELIDSIYGR